MVFSTQIFIVIGALGLILLLAKARRVTIIPTTQAGALAAIAQIQEWSKWMAGIQTAAIAGLALIVFKKDTVTVQPLPGNERWPRLIGQRSEADKWSLADVGLSTAPLAALCVRRERAARWSTRPAIYAASSSAGRWPK